MTTPSQVPRGGLPLAVATGDPAGIGPEVAVDAALREPGLDLVLFGDGDDLAERFRMIAGGAPVPRVTDPRALLGAAGDGTPGRVGGVRGIVDVLRGRGLPAPEPGRPSPEAGRAQLAILDAAAEMVRSGAARALVTGPTSKEAAVAAGIPFRGQTEYLAARSALPEDAVSMLFLGPRLRVGLVTTHLPLRAVSEAVTQPRVVRTARHLAEALVAAGAAGQGGSPPGLVVAGVNPHAGEGGLFGDEEIRVIRPALDELAGLPPFVDGRVALLGLRPAEAAFRMAADQRVAGVVAMAHDQATIASKLLDWGAAVNVTWGLPYLRTSVDHGVAYDIVGTRTADADGMRAALRLADQLTGPREGLGR